MTRRKRGHGEAHVRLYRHELECDAYRALSCNARALLIEMRAMYDPKRGDNRIFMGVRTMRERCGLSQAAAMRARDELIETGWVRMIEPGGFQRKTRHATVYGLENEPPTARKGAVPGKAFMRWRPQERKNTVLESSTERYLNRVPRARKKAVTVLESSTVKPVFAPSTVLDSSTQIPVTIRSALSSPDDRAALLTAAATDGIPDDVQLIMLAAWLASGATATEDAAAAAAAGIDRAA